VLAVIGDGLSVKVAAEKAGVSRQSLHAWLARYEADGMEGPGIGRGGRGARWHGRLGGRAGRRAVRSWNAGVGPPHPQYWLGAIAQLPQAVKSLRERCLWAERFGPPSARRG
jgi:transposase